MKGIENNGQYSKIEKSTTLKGNIKSKTDIRIDGNVDGEVITTGKVILGKESNVIGSVPNLPLLSGSLKPASKVS